MEGVGKKEFAALVAQNVTFIRAGLVLGMAPEKIGAQQKAALLGIGWEEVDAKQLVAGLMNQALRGWVPNKAQAEAVRAAIFEKSNALVDAAQKQTGGRRNA